MGSTEGTFESSGGIQVFFRSWQPVTAPKAVVVVCHGVNSHSGQNLWAGEQLAAGGFAAYIIALPVFILHGTVDKATMASGSQFFYDTAGSKDKTLKLYEGHFHDLLNDIGKDGVMADIQGWINARLPVLSAR